MGRIVYTLEPVRRTSDEAMLRTNDSRSFRHDVRAYNDIWNGNLVIQSSVNHSLRPARYFLRGLEAQNQRPAPSFFRSE
jgi:hypothetical protein